MAGWIERIGYAATQDRLRWKARWRTRGRSATPGQTSGYSKPNVAKKSARSIPMTVEIAAQSRAESRDIDQILTRQLSPLTFIPQTPFPLSLCLFSASKSQIRFVI